MSPRILRIIVPLAVAALAIGVVITMIVGGKKPPPIAETPLAAETAQADTDDAAPPDAAPAEPATPDPATAADADAGTDTDTADDDITDDDAVAIDTRGLRASARGGTSGHDSPPETLGSLDPDEEMLVEFDRAGAGIQRITFGNYWLTAQARRTAKRYHDARREGRSLEGLSLPPEDMRYVLKEGQPLVSGHHNLPNVPALATWGIEVNGQLVNLFDYNPAPEDGGEPEYIWAELAPGLFQTVVSNERGDDLLQITRRFELHDKHRIVIRQEVDNLTTQPIKIRWRQFGPGTLQVDRSRYMDRRRWRFGYVTQEEFEDPVGVHPFVTADKTDLLLERPKVLKKYRKALSEPELATEHLRLWPTDDVEGGHLSWFAASNRYFTLAVHPPFDGNTPSEFTLDRLVQEIVLEVSEPAGAEARDDTKLIFTYLASQEITVAPDVNTALDIGVYAGPLDRHILDNRELPFRALSMNGLILYQMSSFCAICTFQWLAHFLLAFLSLLQSYIVFDWAVAIVCLVVVVRTLLHPITKRSQISMQRFSKVMGSMKPEIEKIQKKYPNDPKKVQQEQLRMMREQGVNPLHMLGCLPMFLQMPIWVALYAMLYFAFDLRQEAGFFGIFQWISADHWQFLGDLSSADHFFWVFDEPFKFLLWNLTGINLLPLLMGAVFFVQQKYMAPPPSPTMTKEQLQQQKIMRVMMVVMFPVMLYSAPSGLTLYILTSSCIGVLESRYIRRHVSEMDLSPKKKPVRQKKKVKDPKGRAYARAMKAMEDKKRAKQQGPGKKYKKRR